MRQRITVAHSPDADDAFMFYALLPHGASMGDGYGPMVVARQPVRPEELQGMRIAVPGPLTTAVLALRLWRPGLEQVVIPFDQILDAVAAGRVDAGLIIPHRVEAEFAD